MNKITQVGVFLMLLFLMACAEKNDLSNLPPYLQTRIKAQRSIVLIKNKKDLLPLKKLESKKIAFLSLGMSNSSFFCERLKKYTQISTLDVQTQKINKLETALQSFNTLIIGFESKSSSLSANIFDKLEAIVQKFGSSKQVILVFFSENSEFNKIINLDKIQSILLAQNENQINQELSAEIIFGGTTCSGKLPQDLNDNFLKNSGIELNEKIRFAYTVPEISGLNSKLLNHKIDSIAHFAIEQGAFPGCQILVAKNMNVVFHKTYGYHTYEKQQKVKPTDIYDMASVTKVAASTLALMKFYEEGKFQLDDFFSNTWTDWKNTNKDTLTWRQILSHQARLKAWIPYWTEMVDQNGNYKKEFLRTDSSELYSVKIKDSLFLRNNYKEDIYAKIKNTKLLDSAKYLYSGLTFYLYPQIVENFSRLKFDQYLYQNFYNKLGAKTLKFNAYKYFPLERIIPTEKDTFFRKIQIHGSVHDEGAIIMGGVSGNAGLFADANDMAKLMQMLCNYGTYGGEQYLKPETVKEFTRIQFPENNNRRGLGFDKAYIGNDTLKLSEAYPAPSASKSSFGHGGFTGTFVWADPENDLVFIFLSNRVFPTRENRKIYELNIRPTLHQAIYDAME